MRGVLPTCHAIVAHVFLYVPDVFESTESDFLSFRHALAAKAINKLLESNAVKPTRKAHELRVWCFKALGWTAWEANARAQLNVIFPEDYPVF